MHEPLDSLSAVLELDTWPACLAPTYNLFFPLQWIKGVRNKSMEKMMSQHHDHHLQHK